MGRCSITAMASSSKIMPGEQLQRLPGDASLSRFGRTFCPGDKVMQVENDYDKDVYNGDNGDLGAVSRPVRMASPEAAMSWAPPPWLARIACHQRSAETPGPTPHSRSQPRNLRQTRRSPRRNLISALMFSKIMCCRSFVRSAKRKFRRLLGCLGRTMRSPAPVGRQSTL